ncbi:hypothetical protein TNCT_554411, partial [Trichonephila clavata]
TKKKNKVAIARVKSECCHIRWIWIGIF